jgi:hypothetical protein
MWWHHSRSRATHDQEEDRESESEIDGTHPAAAELLDLQHAVGNQTMQRVLGGRPPGATESSAEVNASSTALPQSTRQQMEAQFGEEFSDVRVHTDQDAAASAVERGSSAYASGRDIYFAPGKYAPGTPEGTHLLSHELAHVVQQSKGVSGNAAAVNSDPEREADHAAERIVAGGPVNVPLSPVRVGTPMGSPANWSKDVTDAKTAKDATKMAALVETAIAAMKKKVVVANTSSGGNVDPKDYKPLPDLNFDINLNTKKSKPLGSGAATRSLTNNYGHFFTDGGKTYVIVGPKALDESSSVFTEMYVNHELYHTVHHAAPAKAASAPATQPGKAPAPSTDFDDQEVETYTQDFINYFHQLYSLGPQWVPLITYYETASAAAQKSALALLQGYYKSPPSPPIPAADVANVKKAFEGWLRRRLKDSATKKLIQDLSSSLGITLTAPSPKATPAPAPGPSGSPGTPP